MDCINGNWIIKYIFEKINEKLSLITYIQKRKLSMHLKTMNKYYFWTGIIFMLIINEHLMWPRKNSKEDITSSVSSKIVECSSNIILLFHLIIICIEFVSGTQYHYNLKEFIDSKKISMNTSNKQNYNYIIQLRDNFKNISNLSSVSYFEA